MDDGLAKLLNEERALSARRTQLQNRIDFLRSGGRGPAEDVAAQIAELVRQEQELSHQRSDLHERIELARAEALRGRPTPG
jgi:predicted  nucleic acid-binding Zn-ribbon protein